MPEPLIDVQATLQCGHVGTVRITTGNTRVQADKRFLVTMSDDFKVLPDCVFILPPPPGNKHPCTLIQWTGSARRVTICGKPALLQSSPGMSMGPPTQGKPIVQATPDASERDVMHIDYPYRFDGRGRTATTSDEDYVRDLIEQVLFTAPGERVNRPTFGSGILGLVFAGQSDALMATTKLAVQGALQQWLGELVHIEGVLVEQEESTLQVTVQYVIQRSQRRQAATFTREV